MKRILVTPRSIARGELLDDRAVLAALDSGKLSGLAMDAFRLEPPGDDPLVRHDRVIAASHIGAFTQESITRAVETADGPGAALRYAPATLFPARPTQ